MLHCFAVGNYILPMQHFTNMEEIKDARQGIAALLDERAEWFCSERNGKGTVSLRKGEWEISVSHGGLLFCYWSESGVRIWRIVAWEWTDEKLLLDVTRRMGAEHTTLELIPRASAQALVEVLAEARRAACARLAKWCAHVSGAKVERAGLSRGTRPGEPGRYARILLRHGHNGIAVTGPVSELGQHEVDAFLSSALIWLTRLNEKAHNAYIQKWWLVVSPNLSEVTAERIALLRSELQRIIVLYEMDEEQQTLVPVSVPPLHELLESGPRFSRPVQTPLSDTAQKVIALSPEAIDVVRARHGETLRFHGLAFARVRRMMDHEHVWFGVDGAPQRRLLDEDNWPQLLKLIRDLAEHRSAQTDDHRHALYTAAPEAWLESLLRRDITQLDPGLIISPLYTQFRTSRAARKSTRPVDLLALREDGRLVVIELKVSEDVALPLQGADYWRHITAHHRAGHIKRARLFADAVISDDPPLVYLVAPMLRFHLAFQTLARAITPEIEMYRFDINEDWRAGVRVVRRMRVN